MFEETNKINAIDKLLLELEKMPGVGPKSAQRIAYWILNTDKNVTDSLADTIKQVKETVHFCQTCFNYAEEEVCDICSNTGRNHSIICVVSEPRNIPPIERTSVYNGLYHVLGGEISPMEGVGPDDLRIKELLTRLGDEEIKEVVIATNPNIEGETTAAYLARIIKPMNISVTRPASGIPVGGDLEYADEVTLAKALEDRRSI